MFLNLIINEFKVTFLLWVQIIISILEIKKKFNLYYTLLLPSTSSNLYPRSAVHCGHKSQFHLRKLYLILSYSFP